MWIKDNVQEKKGHWCAYLGVAGSSDYEKTCMC